MKVGLGCAEYLLCTFDLYSVGAPVAAAVRVSGPHLLEHRNIDLLSHCSAGCEPHVLRMVAGAGLLLLLLVVEAGAQQALLLVLEGITQDLLDRVPTPALDRLIATGQLARLRPEFPAETLPTLQAMVTGQHSEVTGVLGEEVWGGAGQRLTASQDPEFWSAAPNLTTIWVGASVGVHC